MTPDQIADVSVLKNAAYLASWSEGKFNERCTRGGFFSVDISDPANPKQSRSARRSSRTTTARACTRSRSKTAAFTGDLLAVNNETCTETTAPPNQNVAGGWRLRPLRRLGPGEPGRLSRANGDYGGEGALTGVRPDRQRGALRVPLAGRRARPTRCSSTTRRSTTSTSSTSRTRAPSSPSASTTSTSEFPRSLEQNEDGQGDFGQQLARHGRQGDRRHADDADGDYWDAGYVTLNASDPANLTLHRRHGLRRGGSAARASRRRRATATRPSSRTTTATSWRRTRTSPRTA